MFNLCSSTWPKSQLRADWAFLPGLVAREIVPTSWQWPERMATRVLAEATPWDAGQHLMASAS
ncbi:MAG: hypothetical protein JKY97_12415, partial [Citromicrobium sp.]|nr:hypothetical protein [Citromicrobium sp.]